MKTMTKTIVTVLLMGLLGSVLACRNQQQPRNPVGIEFVRIPGGTFQMGDTFGDGMDEERPVHNVTISDFYLSKYEVTVAQYRAFCQATGNQMPEAPDWAWRDNHPMVNVTWSEADAFCEWAEGRLPTEAEWEYAARSGGKKVKYPNGDTLTSRDANFGNNVDRTTPVGSYPPNKLGLYDMAGNVCEWCADWYDENYYQSSPEENPTGPSSGECRVLRGGSWYDGPWWCRVSLRVRDRPGKWSVVVGFRVARSAR